jgi:predicted acetyltransferase
MKKVNYNIKVFNIQEFSEFCRKYQKQNLEVDIKYFSYNSLSTYFNSQNYIETYKFIVAYTDNIIIGICEIVVFDTNKDYISISYLSIHDKFKNKGIGSKILQKTLEEVKKSKYPLSTSQYSTSGWKYLRLKLIDYCIKNNIIFKDNIVGYGEHDDDFYKLREESKKIFNEKYPNENYY